MRETVGVMHLVALTFIIAAMVLALVFNRSRLFFILLLFLGFTFLAELFDFLRHRYPALYFRNEVGRLLDLFLLATAPFFIAFFGWFKDRGVITPKGWMQLGSIVAAWTLFVYVLLAQKPLLAWVEQTTLLMVPDLGVPELITVIVSLAVLILGGRLFMAARHEGIYLIALVGIVMAALLPRTLDHLIIFVTLFALIAVIYIISNSYYMAYIDELTQLRGRRAMNEALLRLGGTYSIVMGDIDHFKSFNDTYGHDIGDEVLKLVATELDRIKGGGEVFRWGGEEFAVIFNGKKAEDAALYVEQIRMAIEKRPFYMRSKDRPAQKPKEIKKRVTSPKRLFVTMSFGIATSEKSDQGPLDVMKRADSKLYEAKESGRNCVRF